MEKMQLDAMNAYETQGAGSTNDSAPMYMKGKSNLFTNKGYDWSSFVVQEWQDNAACSGMDPQMFEVDGRLDEGRQVEIAKAISVCNSCPVKKQCLEDASEMDLATTIRGGTYSLNEAHGYADPCGACGTVSWQIMNKGRGRKPSRRCGECQRRKSKAWRVKQAAAKLAS